ncbi:MAG: tyrosine-type recombinase/integrase [Hyphomonas sp.]|nr:tyrosine-type recombinase/integrase [Hyphomonas sp.]
MPIRNSVRLTQSSVNSAGALGKKKARYWDDRVPGLVLTVSHTGSKGYFVVYRDADGRQREPLIGDAKILTLDQARNKAMEMLASIQLSGVDPTTERRTARQAASERRENTVARVWSIYFSEVQLRRAKSRNDLEAGYFKRHIEPAFGNRPVANLTTSELSTFLRSLAQTSGPGAANTTLEILRRLLGFAAEQGMLGINPAQPIKPFPKVSRERVGTPEELAKTWQALTGLRHGGRSDGLTSTLAIQIAILTLQRRGEVCGIHWREIDWDNRVWTIPGPRTKNKKGPHSVPLSDAAVDLLRFAFAGRGDGYAFPGRDGEPIEPHVVTRYFARLTESLKIQDLTLHDMRRTGATMMTSERLNVMGEIVSRILNHTPPGPAITQVYNRNTYLPQKRAALDAWAVEVARLAKTMK